MNWIRRTLVGLGSILAVLGAVGSVAAAQPVKAKPATTYIGTLPAEPPARIAVVIEGETFLAYACGQTDDFNKSASAWFKGTVKTGRIEATEDGKELSAVLADGTIRGSLTAEGKEREFTAKPVPPTAIAGLYRATKEVKGDALVLGWIVDAKHQVVGGCQGGKRSPVALKPAQPLPPPPPPAEEPKPEEKQEAEESLIGQFEEEPGVRVQGEKVTSAVKPPVGKVVRAATKKK
jgi:hypothetical protein